jgi:type II secretory ATPase GspE/PulE/Tfp pilus assembly ATPase PilB-like protein
MRLLDMGVEPYLVSSTLIGAMAQRLVRTICRKCKRSESPDPQTLPDDLGWQPGEQFHRGAGCEACRGTGFRGRTGLYELLTINETLAECILHRRPPPELVRAGRPDGLRLLREDGWMKVRQGTTTVDEVVTCTAV